MGRGISFDRLTRALKDAFGGRDAGARGARPGGGLRGARPRRERRGAAGRLTPPGGDNRIGTAVPVALSVEPARGESAEHGIRTHRDAPTRILHQRDGREISFGASQPSR